MGIFSKTTRRLTGSDVRPPPSPVKARDSFPTMVFSLYDQTPPSSRRLLEVGLEAIGRAVEGEVKLGDIAARPGVPQWFTLWPGEHYILLGAMILTLRPKVVVEIGTDAGLSALAMKKYLPEEGRIVTFDIRPWRSISYTVLQDVDFADGRLEQRPDDLSDWAAIDKNQELLESADFLFIDAPKDGVFEFRLMEHLAQLSFRKPPILWFDDTRLWSMLRFWRELPYPKLDLTSMGSWSGTGMVELVKGESEVTPPFRP